MLRLVENMYTFGLVDNKIDVSPGEKLEVNAGRNSGGKSTASSSAKICRGVVTMPRLVAMGFGSDLVFQGRADSFLNRI